MSEEQVQAVEPVVGEELERLMARYARVRLDPSAAQARRVRAAVLAEAAWRLGPRAVGAQAGDARVRGSVRRGWRRIAVMLVASLVGVLVVGSSAYAASRAGGPLYEARLALEALTLPAEPGARLEARLARAQARLAEAAEAAARGDHWATAAALDAYNRAIDELASATGAPADRALELVRSQRTVLLQIAAEAPQGAANGVDRALATSELVIGRLTDAGGGGGSGESGGGSGRGGSGDWSGGAGGAGAGAGGGGGGSGAGDGSGAGAGDGSGNGNANPGGSGNGNGNAGASGGGNAGGNGNGNGNSGAGNAGGHGNGDAGGNGKGSGNGNGGSRAAPTPPPVPAASSAPTAPTAPAATATPAAAITPAPAPPAPKHTPKPPHSKKPPTP